MDHRPPPWPGTIVNQVMKRLLQSVALALAALLAAQPALASMTCAQQICGSGPSSGNCCLSSNDSSHSEMSSDAAMMPMSGPQQAAPQSTQAELSCGSGSCCVVSSPATPKLVSSTKFTVNRFTSFTPLGGLPPVIAPAPLAAAVGSASASAPARYILLNVFRI